MLNSSPQTTQNATPTAANTGVSLPWSYIDWRLLGVALVISLLWRLVFLSNGMGLLCGDQAVVGIMAQRMLAGEFTIFYAGQHYLGQAETILVTVFFFIFRMQTPLVMKLVGVLVSLAFTATTYFLARALFSRREGAFFAALFTAASPTFFTLWSLKQGSFMLTMVLGIVMLTLAQRIASTAARANQTIAVTTNDNQSSTHKSFERQLLSLGLLMGFSLYQYLMIAPFLLATILLLCWSPARRPIIAYLWNGQQTIPHSIIRALLFIPVFALFFLLIIRGVNDWGSIMSRPFYVGVCFCWITLGACTLVVDRLKQGRASSDDNYAKGSGLFIIKWLLAFSVGFSPAIVHVAITEEIFFLGQPANLQAFLTNIRLTPILLFPSLIGDLPLTELGLIWPFELPLSNLPDWMVLLAIALIALCFMALGYLIFKPRDPALTAKERRGATLMLSHMLFAFLFYCLSRESGSAVRHLLPLYVGLFILLGLFTQLVWRLNRPAALIYIIALTLMFGSWNFRHRHLGYDAGSYHRNDILELADWLRQQEINDIYSSNYHICHLLQLELGLEYNITCVFRQFRFADTREQVLNSQNFATIGLGGWRSPQAELEGLEYLEATVGPHTVYYQFQRNGQPVTFREIKDSQGKP